MYQPIDQLRTGKKLKIMIETAGYDVKYIQTYLQLSCPQSIYRWYKGKALPSLEHLSALSKLLHVHMEELLAFQGEELLSGIVVAVKELQIKRVLTYAMHLRKIA